MPLSPANVSGSAPIATPSRDISAKPRVMSGRQQIVRIDAELLSPPAEATVDRLVAAVEAAVARSAVVVLSDYAKGVLSDRVIAAAIAAARAAGVPVIVDPKRRTFEAYRGATLVTVCFGCRSLKARMTPSPRASDCT